MPKGAFNQGEGGGIYHRSRCNGNSPSGCTVVGGNNGSGLVGALAENPMVQQNLCGLGGIARYLPGGGVNCVY